MILVSLFLRRAAGTFRKTLIPIFAILAVFSLWGCYSFSGSTLPPHLRTIQILPVQNQTLESALADRITEGFDEGFRRRTNLRRVNENADAELFGVLTGYSHQPLSTSGERVTSYRVDLQMRITFVDKIRRDTLYHADNVPGYGDYRIGEGETEETGKLRAVESLVKVVLDNTVSRW